MTFDSASLARSLIALVFLSGHAVAERPVWNASKIQGTPDPAPPYKVEPAFSQLTLDRPGLIDYVPGTNRLVVAEVSGKVKSFVNDPTVKTAEVAIDIPSVRPGASAIYGLAFHPRFETNRLVYLCYVHRDNQPEGTRVSRFKATGVDPLVIDPRSEEVVITYLAGGHNGGCLAFGPEGYLYISTGDAASPSPPDPLKTGQDISDLLSSILRIDVDARDPGKAYRVPKDNPFVTTPGARPEVWAYGLRNPWRMSFDRKTGDLWVGDVGWELWEMIHLVRKGSNCGWAAVEGHQPVLVESKPGPTPIVPPVVEHPHSEAASITGGYVYRGSRLPALKDVYIYGDFQSGKVWGLRHDGQKVTWRGEIADTGLRIVAFGEDRAGELYLVEYERSNQIYRLVPDRSAGAVSSFPRRLSETGLFASTRDQMPASGVVPYLINSELWADGTRADRLMAVPGTGRAEVDDQGRWRLPDGSVLARTVAVDLVEGDPKSRRRLETQVLHREAGTWRPYTYLWDDAQADATLADAAGATRAFTIRAPKAPGGSRTLAYRFAARAECALCHNPWVETGTAGYGRQSASPLTLTTAQLDRGDQLKDFASIGLTQGTVSTGPTPALADPRDTSASLDARARSYLQVNCAHCHQENAGGTASLFLTAKTPLDKTRALDAVPAQGRFDLDDARLIAPGAPERSVLYYRMAKTGSGRMPRLGSDRVDPVATRLIADWIAQMPGGKARPGVAHSLGLTSEALATVRRIDEGTIAPTDRVKLIEAARRARPEVRDLFERFLPESDRVQRLGDVFDRVALLSRPGDIRRGRALFRSDGQVSCKSCHKAEGVGVEIGPALDGIGGKYPREDLLTHVVEPSKLIEPKYAVIALETRNGQVSSGILVEESPREVVIRDAKGGTIRVPVEEIERRGRDTQTSLMPSGLIRDLTADQAADLLAYLASLKTR